MVKTVVYASYAHKSNVMELAGKVPEDKREEFLLFLGEVQKHGIEYDVIKYELGDVTLITSPDWDTAHEPIVGTCRKWKNGEWFLDGSLNMGFRETDNYRQVYHHKWMFVASDYEGFDLDRAKERSRLWEKIEGLDKRRIGYKSYWKELLEKNGMEL